jgi:aspartyl protease family protein
MLTRALLLAGAFVLAVALLFPRAEGPALADDNSSAAVSAPARTGGAATILPRAPDGHYYAEAHVDGRPVSMLVDTGASIVALTAADAESLGLFWNLGDAVIVGHGASGPVLGIPVQLGEVEVGDQRASSVRAAIIPEGLPVSLLGQSFLSQVRKVEIVDGEMVLSDD